MSESNQHRIDASPTKNFFISMLVRDVQLIDAIPELIDNCCDGARRARGGLRSRYDGLWVNLDFSHESFRIQDNCGGITIETANERLSDLAGGPKRQRYPIQSANSGWG